MDLPPPYNSDHRFGQGGIAANPDLIEKSVSIYQADLAAAPYTHFHSDFDRESIRCINAVEFYSNYLCRLHVHSSVWW
jgi:hypothetical protein